MAEKLLSPGADGRRVYVALGDSFTEGVGDPEPTAPAEVRAAMSGNLCRCGTYTRIREAIHKAAEGSS